MVRNKHIAVQRANTSAIRARGGWVGWVVLLLAAAVMGTSAARF